MGGAAEGETVRVPLEGPGRLDASLLDARRTFDRLVERYAPDAETRRRILASPFYARLAGHLAGVLEYMAVERLYEVHREGGYDRIVLDTPPTAQALDFLDAPRRIVAFLDSRALELALGDWFDAEGRLVLGRRLRRVARPVEAWLDRVVGLDLVRDVWEFLRAFRPLYEGFRRRAREVQELLASDRTGFILIAGPGPDRVADTLFFARALVERGLFLSAVVVNRVHPKVPDPPTPADPPGRALMRFLGDRDATGLEQLRSLLDGRAPVVALPELPEEPGGLGGLERILRGLA
ncbi:MAG: hypothetical protein D6718_00085 [Acidobacteria bacterium]|nr:MAG: hypothetical protein D6718_00085 [Acidobacteriota bacterium]